MADKIVDIPENHPSFDLATKANNALGDARIPNPTPPNFLQKIHLKKYRKTVPLLNEFDTGARGTEMITSMENETTDQVTGLLNKRGFVQRWNESVEQVNRGIIKGFKLMNLDLDTFKPVNDELGHITGDKVLNIAGIALSSLIRKTDVVGRVGGDEFGILIFDNDGDDSKFIENFEIRFKDIFLQLLDENNLIKHKQVKNVGVSVGLIIPDVSESFEVAWDRADKLMYSRKESKKVVRK